MAEAGIQWQIGRAGKPAKNANFSLEKTEVNEWKKSTVTLPFLEGSNTLTIANNKGVDAYIDQIIITPADQEAEKFAITVRNASGGSVESNVDLAAEGETVKLSVHPNEGFALSGWNVIHGGVTISNEGTFTANVPYAFMIFVK